MMLSCCPLRISVVFVLLLLPYFLDVVANDDLISNVLTPESIALETDLDDDKATETLSSSDIVIDPHTSMPLVYVSNGTSSSYYISQTSLPVSGCRPPPIIL